MSRHRPVFLVSATAIDRPLSCKILSSRLHNSLNPSSEVYDKTNIVADCKLGVQGLLCQLDITCAVLQHLTSMPTIIE